MLNPTIISKILLSFDSMTHKKLQKLCYYLYSWHLAILDESIKCITFEAWIHGPVSPEVYELYKDYGWKAIPKSSCPVSSDSSLYKIAKEVYQIYGYLDANELEQLTHHEEPWIKARIGLGKYDSSNVILDDSIIKKFYSRNKYYSLFSRTICNNN